MLTGLGLVTSEKVVVADDDVRYDGASLARTFRSSWIPFDLVRPQNYFDPLPWHARWDTARLTTQQSLRGPIIRGRQPCAELCLR